MKIMTLGNGFIANHLPYEKITERVTANSEFIKSLLNLYRPAVLINCLGKTGRPNIDECELKKSETYLSNVIIPSIVASECEKLGIHFISIGSGCIYFGESCNYMYVGTTGTQGIKCDLGWQEKDFANPKSYYSKTKYSLDLILGEMSNTTTLRIRMPISSKNDPRNFINKIRGYKQIVDISNSVTFIDDFVKCVDWAAENSKLGIYHVTNPQPLTAVQTMQEFQKYHPEHQFEIINEEQLDKLTIAKRSNCILNTEKLNQAGFYMTPTKTALENCMASYIKNIGD